MVGLRFEVLGGLRVFAGDGGTVALPASRRTRALLGYLLLSDRPRRREHLCELLWERPDDPRGALRWSLSRLRAALGPDAGLKADRETVWLEVPAQGVDLRGLQARLSGEAEPEGLQAAASALREPLLDGLDLPDQDGFQAWLAAQREAARALRAKALRRLCQCGALTPAQALPWLREWVDCDPGDAAALAAFDAARGALKSGAARASAALSQAPEAQPPPSPPPDSPQRHQRIRFCQAADGVRLAYARVGKGPPMVKAANWLSHLELDWDSPAWAPLFHELARDHAFIRYDERGCGLSEWEVADLSFESFVTDLASVIEAAGVDRFPLLGISQGCAVAIAYAARHPERVSHLILWGGYAAGWRISAPELTAEREAVITLVRHGWGRDDPAYRQIFSSTFMPTATPEELAWFNAFQKQTASPENAARFLEVFSRIDVRADLPRVRAPTLVMHARADHRIPLAQGQEIAAGIPGAEFAVLDSENHVLLGREPASAAFVGRLRQFLADNP